jgi:hypothetical protein
MSVRNRTVVRIYVHLRTPTLVTQNKYLKTPNSDSACLLRNKVAERPLRLLPFNVGRSAKVDTELVPLMRYGYTERGASRHRHTC